MNHAMDQSTGLRAEVPPFVPNRNRLEMNNIGPEEPLPPYLTSCYPFVQENDPRSHHFSQLSQWPINPPRSAWQPEIPMFANYSYSGNPAEATSSLIIRNPSLNGHVPVPGYGRQLQQSARNYRPVYGSNSRGFGHSSHQHKRNYNKKSTRRNIGIQKEANTPSTTQVQSTHEEPVMVDFCQQTDFPLSIANNSFKDCPSPLYNKLYRAQKKRTRSQQTRLDSSSSDREDDAESDSGYYSPKQGGNNVVSTGVQYEQHFSMNSRHPSVQQQPCIYFPQPDDAHMLAHRTMVYPAFGDGSDHGPMLAASNHGLCLPNPSPMYLQPSLSHLYGQMSLKNGNSSASVTSLKMQTARTRHHNHHHQQQRNYNNRTSFNNTDHFQYKNSSPSKNAKYSKNTPPSTSYQLKKPNTKVDQSSAEQSSAATGRAIIKLNAEDFPDLSNQLSSNATILSSNQTAVKLSYSAIVTGKNQQARQYASTSGNVKGASSNAYLARAGDSGSKQQQITIQKNKKRLKKEEKATRAANEEYAQISNEQNNLKEALKKTVSNSKPETRKTPNKPTKALNLGDLVKQKLSTQQPVRENKVPLASTPDNQQKRTTFVKNTPKKISGGGGMNVSTGNMLDTTAPTIKRGKEKEGPKSKKPSALKKVILKEREEKKEQRLKLLLTVESPETDVPPFPQALFETSETSVTTPSSEVDENEEEEDLNVNVENSHVPAQQNIVIETIPSTVPQIHSRRYREYCCQILDKEIDDICTNILQKLVFFQDRMYQNDPIKAKAKRRYVLGLREVTKHLKLKKIKCVIISPNLEKIQSKGGLDDAMNQILNLCEEQKVTYVFALGRKAMGCAVGKLVPVSIVGIFDHSGVDDLYRSLVQLVKNAQEKYKEMISVYQHEIIQANSAELKPVTPATTGGGGRRFAHMCHSRNASAASCVSFASFISEPISELNEASNWRMLMELEAITDNSSPALPPLPAEESPAEQSDEEEKEESLKQETIDETDQQDPVSIDCKSSNGTIVESTSSKQLAKGEIIETAQVKVLATDGKDEEMIKSIGEQKPHERVNSWLENSTINVDEDVLSRGDS